MTYSEAWISTFTGRKFHILVPDPEEIAIEDIAHHLSMLCRFTGAVKRFYSVAEHSIKVSQIVPPEYALEGLLHDASEAYLSDLSRPLKHFTEAGYLYRELEADVQDTIQNKFGLPEGMSETVKAADNAMLYTEKTALMPPVAWDTKWSPTEDAEDIEISCWEPGRAEAFFLERFYELYQRS